MRPFLYAIGIAVAFIACKTVVPTVSTKESEVYKQTKQIDTSGFNRIKSYEDLITKDAKTDNGLFTIHQLNDRYYLEIPDSLIRRDILMVNRIVRSAAGIRSADRFFGYGGDQISQRMIHFDFVGKKKIVIKELSFMERSSAPADSNLRWSVQRSNLYPILVSFEIKAYSKDSSSVVVDISDLLGSDNPMFFINQATKSMLSLAAYQPDKSYITNVRSFPLNLELSTLKTYQSVNGQQFFSFELNNSFVLLPKIPMRPRYEDPKVGYFGTTFREYSSEISSVEPIALINRWRLEPSDTVKYRRGILVEPVRPIIFYIDPATPKKWVPYFIKGVNDWQIAFEQAGFKNAIYAMEAPADDPEWSIEDARHNVIVYKASDLSNAVGPNIHDPRSGEILESHINWYHNVTDLLQKWYTVQAGAIDQRARSKNFPDTLMGELIRFVIAHEVGHTLGLAHNMASSSTVPVELLRNKKWVEENGHTPSIMDYARFNYVAQPEDSISSKGIFPRIGVYDKWAIEWGYKVLPTFKSISDERVYMTKWVTSKLAGNKMLWYGFDGLLDPRMQEQDLGDNAVLAGNYGIKNLKRILPHIIEWTKEPGKGYNSARLLYSQVLNQFERYLNHAVFNVGSRITSDRTIEEPGVVYDFNDRMKQKDAISFLNRELFSTPDWLLDSSYFFYLDEGSPFKILNLQERTLKRLLSVGKLGSLLKLEAQFPQKAYTVGELMNDLQSGIFNELGQKNPVVSFYRRSLQKVYINILVDFIKKPSPLENPQSSRVGDYEFIRKNDLYSYIIIHLEDLFKNITQAYRTTKDKMTKVHLERLLDTIANSKNTKE